MFFFLFCLFFFIHVLILSICIIVVIVLIILILLLPSFDDTKDIDAVSSIDCILIRITISTAVIMVNQ